MIVRSNNSNELNHTEGSAFLVSEGLAEDEEPIVGLSETPDVQPGPVNGLPGDVLCHVLLRLYTFQLPATVCWEWHRACQDKALWRSYCRSIWGPRCQPRRWNNDWLKMYRNRNRPLLHGVYCIHVQYTRGGANLVCEMSARYEHSTHPVPGLFRRERRVHEQRVAQCELFPLLCLLERSLLFGQSESNATNRGELLLLLHQCQD